jgi:chromosome partitioning protein
VGDEVDAASVIVHAREGLDFMPAVTELALVEGELAQQPDMQRTLERAVAPVAGDYDLILLDCPPSLGVLSVNALTMADEVFVPMLAHSSRCAGSRSCSRPCTWCRRG